MLRYGARLASTQLQYGNQGREWNPRCEISQAGSSLVSCQGGTPPTAQYGTSSRARTRATAMRIRILEPRAARVDGVDLSAFHPGHNYEVEPSTAAYLIVTGVAEPGGGDSPALVVRGTEEMVEVCAGDLGPIAEVADEWDDELPEPAV